MLLRYLVVVLACLPVLTARAQQAVFPAGARAGLLAPPGFSPTKGFVGFENEAVGGAIVIADLPRSTYDEMLPTFTPEGMAKGGIRAAEPAVPWTLATGEGRMLRGSQVSRGVTYRRWLVLARTNDTAAMVSAMIPEGSADEATPAIEAALKTISFRPPPSLDEQVAALSFHIGDPGGFRPVLATGGLSLLLTDGPSDKPQAVNQPIVYVIAHGSGAQGGAASNAQLARELFMKTPTLRSIVPTKAESSDGITRIEGTAIEANTQADVELVQIVRFANGGYMRAVGIWRPEAAKGNRVRFERLVASISVR